MVRTLEFTARICEKDEQRRSDLYSKLSAYPVGVIIAGDTIEVNYTGGDGAMGLFMEIVGICEMCECRMFKLSTKR